MDSMNHVFFCGDLNYRIDLPREITEYTVMQIEECLQQGNEREADKLRLSLLRHDQLSRVMSEGAAFPGFAEGVLLANLKRILASLTFRQTERFWLREPPLPGIVKV